MELPSRIAVLVALGEKLRSFDAERDRIIQQSCIANPWFTPQSIAESIEAIANNYLNEQNLRQWLKPYNLPPSPNPCKTIGLVMAGNIPLVGWHDFLCVFISGHKAQIKLSGKDSLLFPYLVNLLVKIAPETHQYISIVEQLSGFDAIIATGSNNSARYFEYYFGKYPHIIRKNRSSAAILSGNESPEDIRALGKDVFQYFGMGCRNVSKIFVPMGYDFPNLLHHFEPFADLLQHNKYKNNYEYYYSIYLLNGQVKYASDFLVLQENSAVASPIGVLHYEYYTDTNDLNNKLAEQAEQIQCVVSSGISSNGTYIPFGSAQQPQLWDYADGIDTLQFLASL